MSDLSAGAVTLLAGAIFSTVAALAHLACVLIGAPAYRLMGAGERMARAAEQGRLQPTLVTLAITALLLAWAAFALSGAGFLSLPLTRVALIAISLVYLGRAVAFPMIRHRFPENSDTFWWVSSSICGVIGLAYAFGTLSLWNTL